MPDYLNISLVLKIISYFAKKVSSYVGPWNLVNLEWSGVVVYFTKVHNFIVQKEFIAHTEKCTEHVDSLLGGGGGTKKQKKQYVLPTS